VSKLHRVSQGSKRVQGAVVFLHGLGGHPFATWQASVRADDCWPNWVAQDLPEVDIWTVEYEASPSTWHGSAMALPDRAINLLAWFETERLQEQPLIFVGHSLGGLVVKQLLRLASDRPGMPLGRVLTATRGVVFLGTPNTGSDLASWMDRLRGVLGASAATRDLQSDSAYLRELNGWYRERAPAEDIATLVFAETRATKGFQVVEQASADPGIAGVLPIPVDADHLSIAKPSSRDELVYKRIKQFVETHLRLSPRSLSANAPEQPPTPSQLRASLSAYFEHTVKRCTEASILFDRSKPIPLQSIYVRTYLDHGRSTISDIKFRDFLTKLPANDSHRLFLTIGSAGTGKTFLLRWLFLSLVESQSIKTPFYVELRGIKDNTKVDLWEFLYNTIVGRQAKVSFSSFASALKQGEFILILDGLDEVEHKTRERIARQIIDLRNACLGITLVISSRQDESLNSWPLVRHYVVLPMNKKEAISLIKKMPYKADVKKKFSMDVDSSLYEQHKSFLSNPLLLTIMLLTYSDLGSVPAKMHIFYEQAFETLFYRHDTWKEAGYQRKHYCALPIDEFRDCLSSFCISSYKKSQFEFTMLSAMDLINKASELERLTLDASEFLNDLVETVCILRLEGLVYKFTHRSFQEYFSAFFISRGLPISIGSLLDALVVRQGDIVIPMAMEMNRNLIEREWVLPRIRDLVRVAETSQMLRFAKYLFGGLVYEGSKSGARICPKDSSPNIALCVLYTLEQQYPEYIKDLDGVLGHLSGNDIAELQDRYLWPKSTLSSEGGFPHSEIRASELEEQQKEQQRDKLKQVWSITETDEQAPWFEKLSTAEKLRLLASQIIALNRHLELSVERSKKFGAELLA
jgi:pimeloyl-ACP methyl ester carboxylesterase